MYVYHIYTLVNDYMYHTESIARLQDNCPVPSLQYCNTLSCRSGIMETFPSDALNWPQNLTLTNKTLC